MQRGTIVITHEPGCGTQSHGCDCFLLGAATTYARYWYTWCVSTEYSGLWYTSGTSHVFLLVLSLRTLSLVLLLYHPWYQLPVQRSSGWEEAPGVIVFDLLLCCYQVQQYI